MLVNIRFYKQEFFEFSKLKINLENFIYSILIVNWSYLLKSWFCVNKGTL